MRILFPLALTGLSVKAFCMLGVISAPDSATLGSFVFGVIGVGAAVFERLNAKKVQDKTAAEKQIVSEAQAWKSSSDLHESMAKDYRGLLDTERSDHQKTRDYWHEKATKFQMELSKCNEDCLKLQGRTDITRVENLLLEQGKHLSTLADAIRELLTNSRS